MIHLDTSVLVGAFSGRKVLGPQLRTLLDQGERIYISALVLYEWKRGPRMPEELEIQEALFPSAEAIPFGALEAFKAAEVYKKLTRPRNREIDIAIAACSIVHNAQLWTVNPADFKDIPGLELLDFAPKVKKS